MSKKSSKVYLCEECGQSFSSRSGRYRHHLKHKGVRFTCFKCDKTFARNEDLQKHIKKCWKKEFIAKCVKQSVQSGSEDSRQSSVVRPTVQTVSIGCQTEAEEQTLWEDLSEEDIRQAQYDLFEWIAEL